MARTRDAAAHTARARSCTRNRASRYASRRVASARVTMAAVASSTRREPSTRFAFSEIQVRSATAAGRAPDQDIYAPGQRLGVRFRARERH
jgi:hypothetical protein